MFSTWFNIRFLFWHFQIEKGRLFRMTCSFNSWHVRWATLLRPIWIHEFSPRVGWHERNSTQWRCSTQGQKG